MPCKQANRRNWKEYYDFATMAPKHYLSFYWMQNRIIEKGLSSDFPDNRQGFLDFLTYIGPVPEGMKEPTVGRSDHSLGYIRGNFKWEEKQANSSEAGKRGGLMNLPSRKGQALSAKIRESNDPLPLTRELADELDFYDVQKLRRSALRNGFLVEKVGSLYYAYESGIRC